MLPSAITPQFVGESPRKKKLQISFAQSSFTHSVENESVVHDDAQMKKVWWICVFVCVCVLLYGVFIVFEFF